VSNPSSQTIEASIPQIRDTVPVAVLMRALGCESDRAILNKIVYDPEDSEMCEAFRASLEESMQINT
jgi:DNA-directed RNA polymerase II subunit RPB2